jgi:hypothetical protein
LGQLAHNPQHRGATASCCRLHSVLAEQSPPEQSPQPDAGCIAMLMAIPRKSYTHICAACHTWRDAPGAGAGPDGCAGSRAAAAAGIA